MGLKVLDAPLGRPLTLRLTGELKPFDGVIATEYDAVPPARGTVCDAGLMDIEKSGAGVGVGVGVGVAVGTGVGEGVGVGLAAASLKLPMRVRQLYVPLVL